MLLVRLLKEIIDLIDKGLLLVGLLQGFFCLNEKLLVGVGFQGRIPGQKAMWVICHLVWNVFVTPIRFSVSVPINRPSGRYVNRESLPQIP